MSYSNKIVSAPFHLSQINILRDSGLLHPQRPARAPLPPSIFSAIICIDDESALSTSPQRFLFCVARVGAFGHLLQEPARDREDPPGAGHDLVYAFGKGACLEKGYEDHEGHANHHHGQGEAPVRRGDCEFRHAKDGLSVIESVKSTERSRGRWTYRDERQRKENHTDHGQNPNIITLLNRPPALLNRTTAEQLIPQVLNLLPRPLISVKNIAQVLDDLFELLAQNGHVVAVRDPLG